MNIKLKEHDFNYNRWLVQSLFFGKDEDVKAESKISFKDGHLTVDTNILFENKSIWGSYSYPCPENPDYYTYRKICLAVSAMSFYNAAIKIRPIYLPWGVMTGIRPTRTVRQMIASGQKDEEIAKTLKQLYMVSDEKTKQCIRVAKNELPIIQKNEPEDIGVYIGIPFCPTRCLYCSFISADMRYTAKYIDSYCNLLIKEIAKCARIVDKTGRKIQSIYFGGGTPTSLSAAQLEDILSAVATSFDLKNLKEFCVEAGRPDTITQEKLEVLLKNGVDRISINPQTMNKITLDSIGRKHSASDIKNAFKLARKVGFDNINTDIIAGLPGENINMFKYTLDEVLSLNPESITVHTMSVKRGSKLQKSLDSLQLSVFETVSKMLDMAAAVLPEAGYEPYYMYRQKNTLGNLENVGYAKSGRESLYNINIMEEVQSIFAIGSGGVTKIVNNDTGRIDRIFNYKEPLEYIKNFETVLERKDKILEFFNKE